MMPEPDLENDFFKLSLSEKPRTMHVYPSNATERDKDELEDNCKLAGEVCTFLTASLKFGFENPLISQHFFIALHIYGGRETVIAYYPSKLVDSILIVQNGINPGRYFLLNCKTGLLGTLDRRVDVNERIVKDADGRLLVKAIDTIPQGVARTEAIPALVLVKKQLSDQYIFKKGPSVKQTVVCIITQSDYPDRTIIKL
jgi:hypothetical protein